MDEFLKIDWNPPLEDMLEGDFINLQRLQKESTMYKALRGSLRDPFLDLHEDFDHLVTKELISQMAMEIREKKKAVKATAEATPQEQQSNVPTSYVPGIMKNVLKFPRTSELSAEQQALSLKVLLRYSSSEKPVLSAAFKEELQTYMNLLPVISKEQDAFLEFVKNNWDPSAFTVQEEDFVNFHWKRKVEVVDSLPRYYTEAENIPFVSSKEIGLNFHSTCLEMGTVPKIFLPKLARRVLMLPHTIKMTQRFFFAPKSEGPHKSVVFKTPVSQDPNCDVLAKLHEVDLVISSSGLNCLALNMDPNVITSWTLPMVVKRVNEKNVVFVDKALPPTGLTVLQKNAWLHKYNIKSHLSHPFHYSAVRLDDDPDQPREASSAECSQNDESEAHESPKDDTNETAEDKNNPNFVPPPMGQNLFYRLFSIGSSDESQNELMKNRVDKVYKLLVRSKTDGILKATTGEEYLTMIAAKLEHQLALGAEAVSVEEAAKQWMSLTFRPDTSLIRVRMEATSMEFIQYEKRTAMSINNEIKRLYSLKTEAALTLLYNVAETMTGMNPGRYIMRHTPRNGAFACIYKEADGPGKNVFDLQTIYWGTECPTIPNPPWPPLDKVVVTPALQVFKRMPAMFHPVRTTDGRKTPGYKNQRGLSTLYSRTSNNSVPMKIVRSSQNEYGEDTELLPVIQDLQEWMKTPWELSKEN